MTENLMDILAELNPAQRQSVETIEGPVLILAGPGSGKTRVITHRIAYLIKVCGINPYRIMAVTFTNKAANEMRERLGKLLGKSAEALTLGTFHAICARILRQEGRAIGLNPHFTIYDEDDQISLIKQSLQEVGLDPKQYTPAAIQSAIKLAKSQLLPPGDYAQKTSSYFEEVVHRVYERYQQLLNQTQTVDFDDLLMKTVQLFNQHPDILTKYQSRYIHILVDEFQDTNITQYLLIKQLAGKYRNVCVVGDPDQSIYSWRFADLRNILSFEKDYPDAQIVLLEHNYRSTQKILEAATSIISSNKQRKPKKLVTDNEEGDPITIVRAYNEDEEAQFVVSEIDRLVSEKLASPGDCAVMYRVNAQSRALEEAFMRHGMPYRLVGGTRFYQRREIKDVIAYLKFIHNPSDNVSLMRIINIPGRGIGPRTLTELSAWASDQSIPVYKALEMVAEEKGPPLAARASHALTGFFNLISELIGKSKELPLSDLLEEVVQKSGYREYILHEENGEDRWDNIRELRTEARQYDGLGPEEALTTFLEKVSLVSDIDELEDKSEATVLTTLHQAKGLEFSVVFIVGVEENLLPHRRSLDDQGELEEERRLCYVGVTRAKKKVYLLHTYRRSLFGGISDSEPSRFLNDIPPHLVVVKHLWEDEHQTNNDDDYTPVTALYAKPSSQVHNTSNTTKRIPLAQHYSQKPPPSVITTLLSVGDSVRHHIFGEVISCSRTRDDQEVTVNFATAGVKRLLASLARLEKIEDSSDLS
jgi:DNA helicase-2/ATP-dependent DNA helicase PcrA